MPNWRQKSNPQRVATISRTGREAGRDPRLARLAVAIFRAKGIEPRDYTGQARAIHEFLRDHVYFVNEIDERLQDPAYTLDLQADGSAGPLAAGDCDDFTIAMIALCTAVHLPARAVTSGRLSNGRIVRYVEGVGRSPPARWSHIYAIVAPHPFNAKKPDPSWSFADPTVPGAPFGWDVVSQRRSDPQRGRNDYAGAPGEIDTKAVGSTSITRTERVALAVVSALVVRLLQRWSFWP